MSTDVPVIAALAQGRRSARGSTLGASYERVPGGGFIDRPMSQSREMEQPACATESDGARSRGAAGSAKDDRGFAGERHLWKQTSPTHQPIEDGIHDLLHQCREFLIALWLSPGRRSLALLIVGMVLVICATAVAQVGLNAWNWPFYEAIADRSFPVFLDQLLVFTVIAGCLLVLNVAQACLREMIKLNSREWLTRDLFGEWLKPGRSIRLARAGEVGVNPDQRIHEDARRLTELSADLGVGFTGRPGLSGGRGRDRGERVPHRCLALDALVRPDLLFEIEVIVAEPSAALSSD